MKRKIFKGYSRQNWFFSAGLIPSLSGAYPSDYILSYLLFHISFHKFCCIQIFNSIMVTFRFLYLGLLIGTALGLPVYRRSQTYDVVDIASREPSNAVSSLFPGQFVRVSAYFCLSGGGKQFIQARRPCKFWGIRECESLNAYFCLSGGFDRSTRFQCSEQHCKFISSYS